MTTLKKVVGNANAPVHGTSTYQSDALIGGNLHFVIIDNLIQSELSPNPDYVFNSATGVFDWTPNTFQTGNKIIFVYSNCNC